VSLSSSRLLGSFSLLTLAAVFSGCSGAPETGRVSGVDCRADNECPVNSTCQAGACVANPEPGPQCVTASDCAPNQYCSASGVCTANIDVKSKDIDTPDPRPSDQACAEGTLELDSKIPTVLLLIDQSGSMSEPFDGRTRWNVLRDALTDPTNGVIKNLEHQVRFGIALYSSHGGYGRFGTRTCPELVGLESVPIALGNFEPIRELYSKASPAKDTPTAESIAAATDVLLAFQEEGPKAILLATDGAPDTCAEPEAHDQASQNFAVETVKASHAAGVDTYVLSVGDEITQEHLQAMANAGAGASPGANAPYWKANDQAALKAALESIINGVRSCTFSLQGDVDTALVKHGTVKLDGVELEYGVDWKLNGASEVEVLGARCDALKSGDHRLFAEFPCLVDGVPVVVK
jgi:hypothetical protein